MSCPHCGDTRTEVLKTSFRGRSTYRQRRCCFCKARFSTQERPVSWNHVNRKWPGTQPSRRRWRKQRVCALRGKCEVEPCGVEFRSAGVHRHVDHIVPARLIRRLRLGNPNRRENLQCICGTCHGYKLQADHKLCLGDKLGYREILRTHGFDMPRVERALRLYGL
jgi:HNH endonuclease